MDRCFIHKFIDRTARTQDLLFVVEIICTAPGIGAFLHRVEYDPRIRMGCGFLHHLIHGFICNDIRGLYKDVFSVFQQFFHCKKHHGFMLFCSGPIMDERDTLDWICFLCPVRICCLRKLRVLFTDFFVTLQKLCSCHFFFLCFQREFLCFDAVFLPDGRKVLFQFQKRRSLTGFRFIYKNLTVLIDPCLSVTEKNIIGISAAQKIHLFICNEIFVMHPVIHVQDMECIDGIVDPQLYIFMRAKCTETFTPLQIQKFIHPVQQELHLHAPLRGRIKSCHHITSAFILTEIKRGKYNFFLRRFDHPQTKKQSFLVVINTGNAFLLF